MREFPAPTAGRKALAAFLREPQGTTLALASTGISWVPRYELLAAEGFEVLLVDPRSRPQWRGRPRTDRRAGQGLSRRHRVGRRAGALRPDAQTGPLRA
jgi:hypothetical protein